MIRLLKHAAAVSIVIAVAACSPASPAVTVAPSVGASQPASAAPATPAPSSFTPATPFEAAWDAAIKAYRAGRQKATAGLAAAAALSGPGREAAVQAAYLGLGRNTADLVQQFGMALLQAGGTPEGSYAALLRVSAAADGLQRMQSALAAARESEWATVGAGDAAAEKALNDAFAAATDDLVAARGKPVATFPPISRPTAAPSPAPTGKPSATPSATPAAGQGLARCAYAAVRAVAAGPTRGSGSATFAYTYTSPPADAALGIGWTVSARPRQTAAEQDSWWYRVIGKDGSVIKEAFSTFPAGGGSVISWVRSGGQWVADAGNYTGLSGAVLDFGLTEVSYAKAQATSVPAAALAAVRADARASSAACYASADWLNKGNAGPNPGGWVVLDATGKLLYAHAPALGYDLWISRGPVPDYPARPAG